MSQFSKIMLLLMLGFMVGLPFIASSRGWGLGSETNTKISSQADSYCPPAQTRPDGTCQRSHRSYYFGRSVLGGGPRSGK